ncbi:hypothetical protein SVAN01_02850 [Stagonosporopsis vannaccii]|nr:hypothetical protein SVAN01_02850 [Stagonosporopsis vannaccii]
MSAKYVSGTVYKTCQVGSRIAVVGIVDNTDAWKLPPNYTSPAVKEDFVKVAYGSFSYLNKDTVRVDMKDCEHANSNDRRPHFTAYELDAAGDVICVKHIVKEEEESKG